MFFLIYCWSNHFLLFHVQKHQLPPVAIVPAPEAWGARNVNGKPSIQSGWIRYPLVKLCANPQLAHTHTHTHTHALTSWGFK